VRATLSGFGVVDAGQGRHPLPVRLFQIITEREERASIAIATNLPFSEWGTVFPDLRLVAAIVDRVTFNAHIIETGAQSYRLRTSRTTAPGKRAS